ncbi:hypothetical protein [Flagellimonas beolgyonensis]|uniref:hypothetical protein n=1 Tax=Flagellimonas beolgyonensis TaxID=864064 RepID=UPI000F8E42BE|nr:hypothetical protein [Allomuricauda beolgyonensis]
MQRIKPTSPNWNGENQPPKTRILQNVIFKLGRRQKLIRIALTPYLKVRKSMKDPLKNINVEKQFMLIGEFIVRFEDINDWIRFLIPRIIFKEDQTELQVKSIESLTESITAYPLRIKLDSIIADNFRNCERLVRLNQRLSSKQEKLPEIRNTITHGSYRLGWKDFSGNLSSETLSIQHGKATKGGFEKRSRIISTIKLEEMNKNLIRVSKSYNYIAAIIRCLNYHDLPNQADKYLDWLEEEINSIEKFKLEEVDILN